MSEKRTNAVTKMLFHAKAIAHFLRFFLTNGQVSLLIDFTFIGGQMHTVHITQELQYALCNASKLQTHSLVYFFTLKFINVFHNQICSTFWDFSNIRSQRTITLDFKSEVQNIAYLKKMWISNTSNLRLLFLAGLRIRIHCIRIRIQHFRLNTDPDPDPIRIQGFNDQKLGKKLQLKKLNFCLDQKL